MIFEFMIMERTLVTLVVRGSRLIEREYKESSIEDLVVERDQVK